MTAHQQIADTLTGLANALAPHVSDGESFKVAFDRFYGVEGAYEMFVSDLYDALNAAAQKKLASCA